MQYLTIYSYIYLAPIVHAEWQTCVHAFLHDLPMPKHYILQLLALKYWKHDLKI